MDDKAIWLKEFNITAVCQERMCVSVTAAVRHDHWKRANFLNSIFISLGTFYLYYSWKTQNACQLKYTLAIRLLEKMLAGICYWKLFTQGRMVKDTFFFPLKNIYPAGLYSSASKRLVFKIIGQTKKKYPRACEYVIWVWQRAQIHSFIFYHLACANSLQGWHTETNHPRSHSRLQAI